MSGLPIVLNGARVCALVVGGGRVATRKAVALAEAYGRVVVVAPALSGGLHEAAARLRPRMELVARTFDDADVRGMHLVVAATDSRAVNARVAAAAAACGVLCNLADDPEGSGFWTAAVHRDGPLVVGVSAGGVPAAAARIRDAVAERLDARLGDAVARLGALRARLLDADDADGWRRASAELIGADFVRSVEQGTFAGRVQRWG